MSTARWTEADLAIRGLVPRHKNEPCPRAIAPPTRKAKAAPCPSEHDEQRALIQWAAASSGRYPQLRFIAAIPNGGARHKAVAAKLRAEGVAPGFPDLILPVGRGGFFALFVEMKKRRGGKTRASQQWWIDRLSALGYCARVCRGADEAKDVLLWYLGLPATKTGSAS